MVNRIVDMIIITVHQWGKYGGDEYEQQFESLLKTLQVQLGLDLQGTVRFLENTISRRQVA